MEKINQPKSLLSRNASVNSTCASPGGETFANFALRVPTLGDLPSKAKKMLMFGGQPGRLTDGQGRSLRFKREQRECSRLASEGE